MYIDSNVFVYAALDTDEKGNAARELLKMIEDEKVRAVVSPLVFDEVLWVIQRIADRDAAHKIGEGMLSLPLAWVDVGHTAVQAAMEFYEQGLDPRDALHAGVMKDYGINEIVSEDKDFDNIGTIQRRTMNDIIK